MTSKQSLIIVFLVSVIVPSSYSWHRGGHEIIARVAEIELSYDLIGQKAYNWSLELLRPLSQWCGEKNHPFIESSVWSDKVKEQGWYTKYDWHFSDVPLNAPGFTPKYRQTLYSKDNSHYAVNQMFSTLRSKKVDGEGKSDNILGKSICLRDLIHIIGDIHQPLHNVQRFSVQMPDGDAGGNGFLIKRYNETRYNNLHFAWDHLMDQFEETDSPMTEKQYEDVVNFSQSLVEEYPYENLRYEMEINFKAYDWVKESYAVASSFVYTGITEGEELPEWYVEEARKIIRRRLALGGYRLAKTIREAYQDFAGFKRKMREF